MGIQFRKQRHSIEEYAKGIMQGDRIMLSKAITLVESKLHIDNELAELLLEKLLPHTSNTLRIGVTGVPGAGKSTFIEAFGKFLTARSKKVAVLTIDPSSQKTKGSILGDKTRMEELSNDPMAFVRPSASGDQQGGVHSRTREAMLLCEAAGFDVIIIETVGVGQNETSVKGLVDFFLLLMIAGAGDELQGIKRGIMEMADAILINKADGDNIIKSEQARRQYQNSLQLFPPNENGWKPAVLTCSSIDHTGLEQVYNMIVEFEKVNRLNGSFMLNRQQQNIQWMHDVITYQLRNNFYDHNDVREMLPGIENSVEQGSLPAITAAKKLMELFKK